MTDQILTGTNPAADARLIADVMAAKPAPRLTGDGAWKCYELAFDCLDRQHKKATEQSLIDGDRWNEVRLAAKYDADAADAAYHKLKQSLAVSQALAEAMVAFSREFRAAYFGK